jgi:hypothetical protein
MGRQKFPWSMTPMLPKHFQCLLDPEEHVESDVSYIQPIVFNFYV